MIKSAFFGLICLHLTSAITTCYDTVKKSTCAYKPAVVCDGLSQPETASAQRTANQGLDPKSVHEFSDLFTDLSEVWSRPNSKDVVY